MRRATSLKLSLLVVFAHALMIWADIKRSLEFTVALWLFVVFVVAVAVLGLFSR